jgi:hypothetical protein
MSAHEIAPKKAVELVSALTGQRTWGVRLGHGSFITLEFGKEETPSTSDVRRKSKLLHGEWHLWVYCCSWRLDTGRSIIAGSEDNRDHIAQALDKLNGKVLKQVRVDLPAFDAVLEFEGSVSLRLFSVYSEGVEHWMLYTPDGVVTFGPGIQCSYEKRERGSSVSNRGDSEVRPRTKKR